MPTATWRHPSNTAVKQVKTFTIDTVSSGGSSTWTLTMTLDDGSTVTASYTEDGSPTIAEIVTGLKDAWNDSTNPFTDNVTATEANGTDVILTAATAGVPFDVTLANDGDGTHTAVDTTANTGNEDYGTARNWSTDAVPVASDDVIFGPGSVDAKYGLNQSGVAIGDFKVRDGCRSEFGRVEHGSHFYLRVDPDLFRFEGNQSPAFFDLGAANISTYIQAPRQAPQNVSHAFFLLGSNLATVELVRGNIGIAVLPGETATVDEVICGFLTSQTQDVDLTLGDGLTLTTLTQSGGKCKMCCAATTVDQRAGAELTTEGTGAITTLNAYGTVFPNSTGTVTTLNAFGTVDTSRDESPRTITTLNLKPGCHVILGSNVTVGTLNPPADPGQATVEFVT